MLPLRPGQIERRTHDYKRHGTASLYAAFDILTGQVIGRTTHRHHAKKFLRQINRATPAEPELHVILDNRSTHKTPAIKQWLEKRKRPGIPSCAAKPVANDAATTPQSHSPAASAG